jgi:hypothetical protein
MKERRVVEEEKDKETDRVVEEDTDEVSLLRHSNLGSLVFDSLLCFSGADNSSNFVYDSFHSLSLLELFNLVHQILSTLLCCFVHIQFESIQTERKTRELSHYSLSHWNGLFSSELIPSLCCRGRHLSCQFRKSRAHYFPSA